MRWVAATVLRKEPKIVVDAGCGDGRVTRFLSQFCEFAVGFDRDELQIHIACRDATSDNCRYMLGSLHRAPLADGCADLVFSRSTLQYVRRKIALHDLARLVSMGGDLVLIQNMRFNPLVFLYRFARRIPALRLENREYLRSIRRYASQNDYHQILDQFEKIHVLHSHLFRSVTIFLISRRGANGWVLRIDRVLAALDERLLRIAPPVRHFAWIATVILEGKKAR